MMTHYDRTHAFLSGVVSIKGADLKVCPPPKQGDARFGRKCRSYSLA